MVACLHKSAKFWRVLKWRLLYWFILLSRRWMHFMISLVHSATVCNRTSFLGHDSAEWLPICLKHWIGGLTSVSTLGNMHKNAVWMSLLRSFASPIKSKWRTEGNWKFFCNSWVLDRWPKEVYLAKHSLDLTCTVSRFARVDINGSNSNSNRSYAQFFIGRIVILRISWMKWISSIPSTFFFRYKKAAVFLTRPLYCLYSSSTLCPRLNDWPMLP